MAYNSFASHFVPAAYMPSNMWCLGQFAVLQWSKVEQWEHAVGQPSIARQYIQSRDEKSMSCHPLCVVGTIDNGKYLAVVQGTSFQKTPITEKYAKETTKKVRQRYLAIQHGDTIGHDGTPVLCLQDERRMLKQTYLNLESYFIVEAECLQLWANDFSYLDTESFARLQKYWVAAKRDGTLRPSNSVGDFWFDQLMFDAVQPQPTFKIPPRGNCAVSIKPPTSTLTIAVAAA